MTDSDPGGSKTYCTYPDPDPQYCILYRGLSKVFPAVHTSLPPDSMSSDSFFRFIDLADPTCTIGVTYGITRFCSFANDRQQCIRQETDSLVIDWTLDFPLFVLFLENDWILDFPLFVLFLGFQESFKNCGKASESLVGFLKKYLPVRMH
jgi:hypothetical protein